MKKMNKLLAAVLAGAVAVSAAGCGGAASSGSSAAAGGAASAASTSGAAGSAKGYKIRMVTDTGGVNDQSFNQSSWEGLQNLKKEASADINYMESKQESDYATNLDKAADDDAKLIWGIGFAMAKAISTAAKANPDINYAIADNGYDASSMPKNVTGVMFRAQEPSFIVGYIAGKTTKTGKVGFVGGINSNIIDQFEYGYKAGVAYAAKELNKKITVNAQYAESFSDSSKGKAIANSMYSSGCDIVFHAAGGVGVGVINAAKDSGKYAIGVDRDQAYLAPNNVLTSALKLVHSAVEDVSKKSMKGEAIGGKTYTYGLTEDAVGIPTEHKLMGDATYNAAMKVESDIKSGKIVPPANKAEYEKFQKTL
ncbi:BMP family lipoprotein [Caproicibacterium lactatifermentans]|jgi:basic membrane protein A|uniref:BMP family ABC transporter substrate-binding protein n=1 Tax=Caproicibacterium lactatifermentans TaxID=2666138 RepID=A0A859DRU2_9FIRM|nr:BMP family ABC transporter substrate-binding protein [Caproicibacterium lactatifermentans]QKN24384.1 BMP family ABC transporter substrate-binding protein [Caproicibacterium lactatifermentans]QKO30602.1 BMP family ABC transporter substrate-binding protein [Caproicibacterium lactatifermentans]